MALYVGSNVSGDAATSAALGSACGFVYLRQLMDAVDAVTGSSVPLYARPLERINSKRGPNFSVCTSDAIESPLARRLAQVWGVYVNALGHRRMLLPVALAAAVGAGNLLDPGSLDFGYAFLGFFVALKTPLLFQVWDDYRQGVLLPSAEYDPQEELKKFW